MDFRAQQRVNCQGEVTRCKIDEGVNLAHFIAEPHTGVGSDTRQEDNLHSPERNKVFKAPIAERDLDYVNEHFTPHVTEVTDAGKTNCFIKKLLIGSSDRIFSEEIEQRDQRNLVSESTGGNYLLHGYRKGRF